MPSAGPAERPTRSFEAQFEKTHRSVLAYALRRTVTGADAEDAVAETYAIAWRRFHDVPDSDEALFWLYAVTRRVIANQRRGNERRFELVRRLRTERVPPVPVTHEQGPAMAALDQLRSDDQEILRLVAWEDLSHGEIAQVLGISPNAVAIRLHRARARFRSMLKESGTDRTSIRVEGQLTGQIERDAAG